jgi:uncharacterized membrane protein YfcA
MTAGLGVLVGLILGLTGAGGAIIAVPLLIFALNWDVARSAPVALVAVGASAALGAVIGLRQKIVRYRAAVVMAAAGALITPLGLWIAHRVPAAPLSLVFAAVLIYVAHRMFVQTPLPMREVSVDGCWLTQAQIRAPCRIDSATGQFAWTAPCARALGASGLITGFLSGLLGVGGGFVIVPALRRATDLPMNSVVATSLMVIALVSTFAVIAAAAAGHLDVAVAIPFSLGALAGMFAGRTLAPSLGGARLQQGFAAVSVVVAVGLIVKTIIALHG